MNSLELHKEWKKIFQTYFGSAYTSRGFIGNEYQFLKLLLERYSEYDILLAMENAVEIGGITSVKYFFESIEKYLPTTQYSKYVYLARKFGGEEEKHLLQELLYLESKWIVSAEDSANSQMLIERLDKWIDSLALVE